MGTGFAKRKKQAKMLQEQLTQMQEKMRTMEVTGTSGGGLVSITLTGEQEIKSIKIQKECVDPEEVEALEDLIMAAYKNASEQLKNNEESQNPLSGMMGNHSGGFPDLSSFGL